MRTDSRRRSVSNGDGAVPNEIVINASAGETRVAILEQGSFTELHIERESDRSVTGTVVLGRVTRVLPGMQAAFVDVGLDKAAFLYVGDYIDPDPGAEFDEDSRPRRSRGRNGGSRQVPRIDTLLREGQEIVVQVAKDPIGTKGARITSHVSIAGRHIVLTPWAKRVGVSRRIDSDRERRRLREIVTRIRPADLGFIIRTAGNAATEPDLEADVKYLTSVWEEIQARRQEVSAPADLYRELSLPVRVLRDVSNAKTRRIVVDDEQTYRKMHDFLTRFVADPKPDLEHYQEARPIFDKFGIESNIDENLGRKVWLKSGGYLIVDQSEALTAIDVNTGRYVGKRDLEETVLKTNLEAVKEVVHQLRFRNIGGLIIVDLIDMESAANREKVYRAFQEALRGDKSKTNILKISELGLVEMTRKRTRENLVQQLCEPCSYCEGRSYVLSSESVAYKILREIRTDLPRFCGRQIAVTVNPLVAEKLNGPARKALASLAEDLGREIVVRTRPGIHQEQFEVSALDEGPAVELSLGWLTRRDGGAEESVETAEASPAGLEDPAEEEEEKPEPEAEATAQAGAGPAEAAEADDQEKPEPEIAAAEADDQEKPEPEIAAAEADDQEKPEPEIAAAEADASPPPARTRARARRPKPAPAVAGGLAGPEAAPQLVDSEEENPILRRSEESEES